MTKCSNVRIFLYIPIAHANKHLLLFSTLLDLCSIVFISTGSKLYFWTELEITLFVQMLINWSSILTSYFLTNIWSISFFLFRIITEASKGFVPKFIKKNNCQVFKCPITLRENVRFLSNQLQITLVVLILISHLN